jgi:hypothetical protein
VDLVWQLSWCPVTSRDSFYVIVAACAPAQLGGSTIVGTARFRALRVVGFNSVNWLSVSDDAWQKCILAIPIVGILTAVTQFPGRWMKLD